MSRFALTSESRADDRYQPSITLPTHTFENRNVWAHPASAKKARLASGLSIPYPLRYSRSVNIEHLLV